MMLSDDELTELECAILDACEEKRREGWRIRPNMTWNEDRKQCCPAAAMFGGKGTFARFCDAIGGSVSGFDSGFDGDADYERSSAQERALFAMGCRFRERLERGEL